MAAAPCSRPPPLKLISTRNLLSFICRLSASISPDAHVLANPLQVRASVEQSPRAIGFSGASLQTGKVTNLNLNTSLAAEASFVVRGEPSPVVERLAEAVKTFIQ